MPVISDKTHLYDLRLPTIYPEGSLTLSDGRSLLTNTPSNMLRIRNRHNTIRDNARILSRTVLKPLKGLEIAFEYTFNKSLANQRKNKAVIDYTTVQLAVQQTAPTSSLESKNETTDYNAFNLYGITTIYGMIVITLRRWQVLTKSQATIEISMPILMT